MAKKKNSKKDPYRNHYLMQEGRDIKRIIKGMEQDLKEAKRVAKMTPMERSDYDKEWDRRMPVKVVKVGKKGLVKLLPKKPNEPSGSSRTRSQFLLEMLERHNNKKGKKK